MLDPERRRTAIQQQIDRLCVKAGVGLNADDALLDQAVYTTEWPCAVLGSFKPEYLAVPSEILITSMKEHQGFFSVRDKKSGKLAPHFIAIANNEPKNMALIRTGNERVLAARLADAKFFFDEDRKMRLEERGQETHGRHLPPQARHDGAEAGAGQETRGSACGPCIPRGRENSVRPASVRHRSQRRIC